MIKINQIDEYTYEEPLKPQNGWVYTVSEPKITKNGVSNVIRSLQKGQISCRNEYVQQMTENLKKIYQVPSSYVYANGFSTLVVALKLESVGENQQDEVIIPSFTMNAVATSVLSVGARVVLVDNEQNKLNPSPDQIQKKINANTKAIIISHTYGEPADIEKIKELATKNRLVLIEDISESIGSLYNGKYLGTFGDYGCASLYANKLITTGEGGFIISNKKIDEKVFFSYACHGFKPNHHFYHDIESGNYKISGLAAAFGSNEPNNIEQYGKHREFIDFQYRSKLDQLKKDDFIDFLPNNQYGPNRPWVFGIKLNNKKTQISVPQIRKSLAENFGIETRAFFRPMHLQPYLIRKQNQYLNTNQEFQNSENLCKYGFYIPTHNNLNLRAINYISEAIKQTIEGINIETANIQYQNQLKMTQSQPSPLFQLMDDDLQKEIMGDKILSITQNQNKQIDVSFAFLEYLVYQIKEFFKRRNLIYADSIITLISSYEKEHYEKLQQANIKNLDLVNNLISDFKQFKTFTESSPVSQIFSNESQIQDFNEKKQNQSLVSTTTEEILLQQIKTFVQMNLINSTFSIIEIGPMYGASTIQILKGLKQTNYQGKLYCYDYFITQDWMIKRNVAHFNKNTESFLHEFEQNIETFQPNLIKEKKVIPVKCQYYESDQDNFSPQQDYRSEMKQVQYLFLDAGISFGFCQQVLQYFEQYLANNSYIIILNFTNLCSSSLRKFFTNKIQYQQIGFLGQNGYVFKYIELNKEKENLDFEESFILKKYNQNYKKQYQNDVETRYYYSDQNFLVVKQSQKNEDLFKTQQINFGYFDFLQSNKRQSVLYTLQTDNNYQNLQDLLDAQPNDKHHLFQLLGFEIKKIHSFNYENYKSEDVFLKRKISLKPRKMMRYLFNQLKYNKDLTLLKQDSIYFLEDLFEKIWFDNFNNKQQKRMMIHGCLKLNTILYSKQNDNLTFADWIDFKFHAPQMDFIYFFESLSRGDFVTLIESYLENNQNIQKFIEQIQCCQIVSQLEKLLRNLIIFEEQKKIVQQCIKNTNGVSQISQFGDIKLNQKIYSLQLREELRKQFQKFVNCLKNFPIIQQNEHEQIFKLEELVTQQLFSYIDFFPLPKIKIITSSWDHFVGGWKTVDDLLIKYFHLDNSKTLFLSATEQYIRENSIIGCDNWAGFIHNIQSKQDIETKSQQDDIELMKNQNIIKNCKGLFFLTQKQKQNYLKGLSEFQNLYLLQYPLTPPRRQFNFSQFERILKSQTKLNLYFIGFFERKLQDFHEIQPKNFEKILFNKDFSSKTVKEYQEKYNIKVENKYLKEEEYIALLTNGLGVIFLSMHDAGGTTLVLEAIAHNTPIVLNRLQAHEQYLGKNYPLFYDNIDQAMQIIDDNQKLIDSYNYLVNMDKTKFYPQTFLQNFAQTAFFQTVQDPPKQLKMTVILITFKRVFNLESILTALMNQDCSFNFELIIWNNNTQTQNQIDLLYNQFKTKFHSIKLIQSTQNYYCIIRESLSSLAKSELLMMIDDDLIPSKKLLSTFYHRHLNLDIQVRDKTVLCIRGVKFIQDKCHLNYLDDYSKVWEKYEGIKFYDQHQDETFLDVFHADCCLIPVDLMNRSLQYKKPKEEYALVDDYWYSFVFSHYLDAHILKINASNLIQDTESATDIKVALHKNPKVKEIRSQLYAYHRQQGWPQFEKNFGINLMSEQQLLKYEQSSNISSYLYQQKIQVWKKGFSGFNIGYNLGLTDFEFLRRNNIQVCRIGAINQGKSLYKINEETHTFEIEIKDIAKQIKKYIDQITKLQIYLILVFVNLPGYYINSKDERIIFLQNGQQGGIYLEQIKEFWYQISLQFKDNPYVIGYDILNEPKNLTNLECIQLYKSVISSIRTQDKQTPIIIESSDCADIDQLTNLFEDQELAVDKNLIFSCHFYEPYIWTSSQYSEKFEYPGEIPLYYSSQYIDNNSTVWDRNEIKNKLDKLVTLMKNYKIKQHRVYFGEFGVKRFAKGALQYIQDFLTSMNELNFNWCIYSFREIKWDGMNYEYGEQRGSHSIQQNSLFSSILQFSFQKNRQQISIDSTSQFLQTTTSKYEQFQYDWLQYNSNFFMPEQIQDFEQHGKYLKLISYYNQQITDSSNLVFIVGCGRSGTTLVSKVCSFFNECCILNEPRSIWISADKRFDIWTKKSELRNGTLNLIQDISPEGKLYLLKMFQSILNITNKRILIQKQPEFIFHLDLLFKMFANAKVIYVERQKQDVVKSILRMENWYGVEDYKWKELQKIYNLAFNQQCNYQQDMQIKEKAELEWEITLHYYNKFVNQQQNYNRLLKINLGELLSNSKEVIGEISRFLNINVSEQELQNIEQIIRKD